MTYDLPPEITVTGEGPVRTVTINRPDELGSVNANLHWGWPTCGGNWPPTRRSGSWC